MIRTTCAAIAFVFVAVQPALAKQHDGPTIRNYEVEGDLAPNAPLVCAPISEVDGSSNPVDLYIAARECLIEERSIEGRDLYILAEIRGRFDARRVSDTTAHQAVTVARQSLIGTLDEGQIQALQDALSEFRDPAKRADLCTLALGLPRPSYRPQYMISHGMGAFLGGSGSGGLVSDFDPESAYEQSVEQYLRCASAREEIEARPDEE